ncbi:unnamed protein product [Albugo candida]|uniref:Chromo domain-containing protein n=1 Tax=Albugo candida TaxID=65357 RepID=A0A024FVS5_9STRA|nr:unnamed protein product [Albugo candida]|eukprot:CCI10769.1 unnamed protein product [Albugo candida]
MHIIEQLLQKRQFNRKPAWLVKWHGLLEHEATWEREKDIRPVPHWNVLIADFKKRQREVNSGRMCEAMSVLAMLAQQQELMRKMAEAIMLKDIRFDEVKENRYSGQMQKWFALLKEQV